MGCIRVDQVRKRIADGSVTLEARLKREGGDFERIFFRYPEVFAELVSDRGDAFLPVLLLPCMSKGLDLEIDAPVSPQLLENSVLVQDIKLAWWPEIYRRVEVRAPAAPQETRGTQTGTFFSLGVDSFYTLLKNLEGIPSVVPPIDLLVYMKGVETPLSRYVDGQDVPVIAEIEKVGAEAGKRVLVGETNFRDLFDLSWARHYHGSGLAGVGLSLGAGVGTMVTPSTHSYLHLQPFGSHPLHDPLYSTEATRIVHDGSELTRGTKIDRLVGRHPLSLAHLRVCTKRGGGAGNCGKCEKCYRTMTVLHAIGMLGSAATFPDVLPRRFYWQLRNERVGQQALLESDLELVQAHDRAPASVALLARALRRGLLRRLAREMPGPAPVTRALLRLLSFLT